MDCADCRPSLPDYLRGELPPGRMRALQLHLDACAPCREAAAEARKRHDVVAPLYLAAFAHGECTDRERAAVETHLPYCESCRREAGRVRAVANELAKSLGQYQLPRTFRARVMQTWKPHRLGQVRESGRRGLADLIDRAEAGNTFSFERHVDRYKDYAYVAAFLAVHDFLWAGEIARNLFVLGFPVFDDDLDHAGFRRWLRQRVAELGESDGWGETAPEEEGAGLAGYRASRKLRRHRIVQNLYRRLPEEQRIPFLLYYVQRLGYGEIGRILERSRDEVLLLLGDATAASVRALHADDEWHPRQGSERRVAFADAAQ